MKRSLWIAPGLPFLGGGQWLSLLWVSTQIRLPSKARGAPGVMFPTGFGVMSTNISNLGAPACTESSKLINVQIITSTGVWHHPSRMISSDFPVDLWPILDTLQKAVFFGLVSNYRSTWLRDKHIHSTIWRLLKYSSKVSPKIGNGASPTCNLPPRASLTPHGLAPSQNRLPGPPRNPHGNDMHMSNRYNVSKTRINHPQNHHK